jgi:hypothetical protein
MFVGRIYAGGLSRLDKSVTRLNRHIDKPVDQVVGIICRDSAPLTRSRLTCSRPNGRPRRVV